MYLVLLFSKLILISAPSPGTKPSFFNASLRRLWVTDTEITCSGTAWYKMPFGNGLLGELGLVRL